jgi:hypothetical protein
VFSALCSLLSDTPKENEVTTDKSFSSNSNSTSTSSSTKSSKTSNKDSSAKSDPRDHSLPTATITSGKERKETGNTVAKDGVPKTLKEKVWDAIISCVQLPHKKITHFILHETDFVKTLVRLLLFVSRFSTLLLIAPALSSSPFFCIVRLELSRRAGLLCQKFWKWIPFFK